MSVASSPEMPKQRKKDLATANHLNDSSSPPLLRTGRGSKVSRLVSPAHPVPSGKSNTKSRPSGKSKTKSRRSKFLASKMFEHQCLEDGRSDATDNSSDDGEDSDLSCVSHGQNHSNAERHQYLEGLGSQSLMPPPMNQARFVEEDRVPLAMMIERRLLEQRVQRREAKEQAIAAAAAAQLASEQVIVAPQCLNTMPGAAAAEQPLSHVRDDLRIADPRGSPSHVPEPTSNVGSVLNAAADAPDADDHEVVNVSSTSPPRNPFFGVARTSNVNSLVTFSALRIGGSVARSPANPTSLRPTGSRLKLKKKCAISSDSAMAADVAPLLADLNFDSLPLELQSTAAFNAVVEMPALPCARTPLKVSSPLRLDSSPIPMHSKPTASPLPFTADDSPVSRLEAFRTIMASRPQGTYGFNTWTQMDRVHQTSRETQTSPLPQVQPAQSQTSLVPTHYQVNSTLTLQDLRNELAVASLALVRAFGF